MAFTLKRAPSGLLKWRHGMVRPTMLCLFLTFGIWGLCKIFTNLFQIRQVLLCRLSQVIGNSSTTIPRQKVCHQERYDFERKCFLQKGEWENSATRRDNSIFVIRSKERNLGSNSRVSYCDWYESLYSKMYGLRSNLQLNHVGKARANLSGAQARYCC